MSGEQDAPRALPPGDADMFESQAEGPNPLLLIHRALRGRYVIAIILGMLLAAPMGAAGYMALQPTYTASGLIQIKSLLEGVVYDREDEVTGRFERFMETQVRLLQSRRTLERAVTTMAREHEGTWSVGEQGIVDLRSALSVGSPRRSELIIVEVSTTDAQKVAIATNAVLDAYWQEFGEQTQIGGTVRERQLEEVVRLNQRRRDTILDTLRELSEEYGTDDLTGLRDNKVAELASVDSQIAALNLGITELEVVYEPDEDTTGDTADADGETDPAQDGDVDVTGLTAEQLAQGFGDTELSDLLDARTAMERQLRSLSRSLSSEHRSVRTLRTQLDVVQEEIEARADELRAMIAPGDGGGSVVSSGPSVPLGGTGIMMSLPQMREALDRAQRRRELVAGELRALNATRVRIQKARDDLALIESTLGDARVRLEQLRTEAINNTPGRVQILERGSRPFAPSADRRIPLAAAGLMAGFGAGVGLVALIAFARPGIRFIADFEPFVQRAPLIGVLPDLEAKDGTDGSAALSVHHLRNLLHVTRTRAGGQSWAYAVTSPTSGDGKTSLTYALGLSFATVGQRTLVIDADLVASGLTRQLDLDGEPGLWEATEAEDLDVGLHPTTTPTFWAVPIGSAEIDDPERLSGDRLERIIAAARERFDVVIVDTGPVLGSLDASLASSVCDRVILTVGAGQRPRLIKSALDRLESLHAVAAGIVFNRASWKDLRDSTSPVSLNSWSIRSVNERDLGNDARARSRQVRGQLVGATRANDGDGQG